MGPRLRRKAVRPALRPAPGAPRITGKPDMKRLAAALLIIAQPAAGVAATESVSVIGGKLGPTLPVAVFHASLDHIVVFGLPANWSAGVNVCHTARPGDYPRLRFTFNDGNETISKLTAQGYSLSNGSYGLPATMLTVCRDGQGNVLSVAAQIAAVAFPGSGIAIYEVYAANTSPTQGSSASSLSVWDGAEAQSFTAYSGAVNRVAITR
jgi:hypothetical protein